MQIETPEEAWKALVVDREYLLCGDYIHWVDGIGLKARSRYGNWFDTDNIGEGPWTVYKEEKKPEPLVEYSISNGTLWTPRDTIAALNKQAERINYLLENIDKK